MTSVVLAIDVNAPAGEILRLFAGYAVHHLPVLSGTKVAGMISTADVLKIEAFLPRRPGRDSVEYLNRRMRIDQIMRRPAITITDDESMERAARVMVENGIHALPVTTVEQDLLGIITSTDIMHGALYPERYGGSRAGSATEGVPAGWRLSPGEMSEALQLAATSDDVNNERGKIARALLQTQVRLKRLESVLSAADRYIRAGRDERLHSILVKAIETARDPDPETLR